MMLWTENDTWTHWKAFLMTCSTSKKSEVLIANERYQHFVGEDHPNHNNKFTEDGPYGANKRNKLEEFNDEVNTKKIKLADETKIETV